MNKVFVYVQHLLGSGHLHRIALITKTLAKNNFDITVVSGGTPDFTIDFGEVNFFQLPPIHTDANFSELFDQEGKVVGEAFKLARKNTLIRIFENCDPELLLLETYPFGRRQMRFELMPLLKKARSKPAHKILVACSIRDIIQPKAKQKRRVEIIEIIDTYFDYVFVHGDSSFIEFEKSFPEANSFHGKLIYTGYIAKPFTTSNKLVRQSNHVLVSAGGGAVGQSLYQTAIRASQRRSGQRYTWHILVGTNLIESEFERLKPNQTKNIIIERNRTNFIELLSQCSVSVSQGGYNTMMDLLITNTPAIIVPFEGQGEQEQLIRANAFDGKTPIKILREEQLSTSKLIESIAYCMELEKMTTPNIAINGADNMARFLIETRTNDILGRSDIAADQP